MDDYQEIKADLKEMKADTKELLQRSAIHNQILMEHKNFSVALQNEQKIIRTELEPIKAHVHVMSLALKVSGMVFVGFIIQLLIHYFLNR